MIHKITLSIITATDNSMSIFLFNQMPNSSKYKFINSLGEESNHKLLHTTMNTWLKMNSSLTL